MGGPEVVAAASGGRALVKTAVKAPVVVDVVSDTMTLLLYTFVQDPEAPLVILTRGSPPVAPTSG